MYNTRSALICRTIRLISPAVQRPYAHARAVSTVGPRAAAPDPTRPSSIPETEGPKKPQDRNALYIGGGGLVGLGAVWYYFATREKEGLGHQKVRAGSERNRTWSVDDTMRSEKERTQESIKSGDAKYQETKAEAQAKVQSARDQVGQGLERGRQRFEGELDQATHRAAEVQATIGKQSSESVVWPGIRTIFLFVRAKSRCSEEDREGMVELGKVGKRGFN